MGLEAASLAVMSFLHLSGILAGGKKPFDPTDAGIAEAIICVVLAGGAITLKRGSPAARSVSPAAIGLAIFGFLIGLFFTISAGDAIDVAYHSTLLPLLAATLFALLRTQIRSRP
jgi:glycerol uptake facilitator-like aquaporin